MVDFSQWPSTMLLPEPTRTLSIFKIKSLFAAIRLRAEFEVLTDEELFVIASDDELLVTGLQEFSIPPDCFLKFFSAIEAMFQRCVAPCLHETLHTTIMPCGS